MPEPTPQKPEGSDVDLTNYVPKSDYEKAIQDAEAKVAGLKKELDAKKVDLLDPEYLEFRESKQRKAAPKAPAAQGDDRVAALESRIDELTETLNVTRGVAERLYFEKELENTRREYEDFDEYKEDVEAILTASKTPLTYKQAYLMAKDSKTKSAPSEGKKEPGKKPPQTEKPSSTIQAQALQKKEYKTTEEADKATLAALREKYPDLGDTL